jgi:hypothetical protein
MFLFDKRVLVNILGAATLFWVAYQVYDIVWGY